MRNLFLLIALSLTINCWTQSSITLENKDAQATLQKLIEGDYYQKQFRLISAEVSTLNELYSSVLEENKLLNTIHKNDLIRLDFKDERYLNSVYYFNLEKKDWKRKKNKTSIIVAGISIPIGIIIGIFLFH